MADPIILDKGNGRERIEFKENTFKGKHYIDIRTFYYSEEDGDWGHTKKGITIRSDFVHLFLEKVLQLMSTVNWKDSPFDFTILGRNLSKEIFKEHNLGDTEFSDPVIVAINDHRAASSKEPEKMDDFIKDVKGGDANGGKKQYRKIRK